jgi:hypothetical protein
MKKNLVVLAICLAFVVLVASCTGAGSAVSRQQAQIAYAAAWMLSFESISITLGSPGTDWVDDGTSGTHMKRRNVAGTVFMDWDSSNGAFPSTLTAVGYLETATGYTFDGTIVGVTTDATHSTTTYNLTLSHPTLTVNSMIGTLTTVSSVTTGSLSFNGASFTYAELMGP